MKKVGILFIVLIIASLVLAACSSKETTPAVTSVPENPEVVVQPTSALVLNSSGESMACALASLIPEVPADQIPPIPLASEDDWIQGSLDAEVSIIEYSDFQCPYCAIAAPQLEQFFADNSDKVNFVFRSLPLISIHPNSMFAHRAAEAAGAQGQFFKMHDVLFENQKAWSSMAQEDLLDYFKGLAENLGLDLTKFEEVYNSEDTINKLSVAYSDATENIGITATPTVFVVINGVPYSASYDYATLTGILKLIELNNNRYMECPPMVVDTSVTYEATVSTTKGDFVIELYPDKAPLTVNSFVYLASEGFYNNVDFHRVIPGFVAQVGDPTGMGIGGPGYTYVNEITDLTFDSEGVVGMANSGADSNGSQFFITYAAQPDLDGSYTVFGKVVSGLDVVESLTAVDPSNGVTADTLDKIISISISEK